MSEDSSASKQIDEIIKKHGGWKSKLLTQLRATVNSSHPDVIEEVKWKMPSRPEGLPVWSSNGILCFAEIWRDNIKLLFPKGAKFKDPKNLFNARLKSSSIRAIEFREGDAVNEPAVKELVKEAVKLNT